MCRNALLVKETMLKIKINKLMDFTVSVFALICFVTGDDYSGCANARINFAVNRIVKLFISF